MIYQFNTNSTTARAWKNSKEQDKKDHLADVKITAEVLDFMQRKNFKTDSLTRLIVASYGMDYKLLKETGFYN